MREIAAQGSALVPGSPNLRARAARENARAQPRPHARSITMVLSERAGSSLTWLEPNRKEARLARLRRFERKQRLRPGSAKVDRGDSFPRLTARSTKRKPQSNHRRSRRSARRRRSPNGRTPRRPGREQVLAEEHDVRLEHTRRSRHGGTTKDEKSARSRSASPSGASAASRSSQSGLSRLRSSCSATRGDRASQSMQRTRSIRPCRSITRSCRPRVQTIHVLRQKKLVRPAASSRARARCASLGPA